MKQTLNIALILLIFLTACSAVTSTPLAPTETPHLFEPTFTETLTPAPGEIPTETPTATSSVPMIEVDGLQIPEPKVSNPELFDLTEHLLAENNSPIVQFANAFGVNPEEVGNLTPQLLTGIDGKQLVVLTTGDLAATTNFDESDTPLLMAQRGENGKWVWSKATLRPFADMKNMSLAAPLKNQYLNKPGYAEIITQNVNKVLITEDLNTPTVFKNFRRATWQTVLDNWDQIEKQLDEGVVPSGFNYNWAPSKAVVDFAKQNDMLIKCQNLLGGGDIPDSMLNSDFLDFNSEQLSKILEFTVRTKILQYKGQIQEWDVADELLVAIQYMPYNGRYSFWPQNLGGEQVIIDVARWAKQTDPSIKLVLTEDHVMEKTFGNQQPQLNISLFNFLRRVKTENVPIDGVDIENNLWIYNPPDKDYMISILKQISDLGFYNATTEATVITSLDYPIWYETPATPITVDDPLIAQAELYQTVLKAYLEAGTNSFGFGDLADDFSWYTYMPGNAEATVLDQNHNPKPAYYAFLRTLFNYVNRE